MKNIYVETSIFSFLASRPSANLIAAAWQRITLNWWEIRRKSFQLFVSELVRREAMKGDKEASSRRMEYIRQLPLLDISEDAIAIAEEILSAHVLPTKAADDALHISIAATKGMDYLLTWNCRHIDNAEIKPGIRKLLTSKGFVCPEICTPEELMGVSDGY